jgi:hypothetical protein
MSELPLPACVQQVNSFDELVATPFVGAVNALCWARTLPGDFEAVVSHLGDGPSVEPLSGEQLRALPLSASGIAAVDAMLADLQLLRERGLSPELNCIRHYPRDEDPVVIPVDVYSFHADSAPVEADTWLCTYHGASSEGLPNAMARRRAEIPETRAALLAEFGGEDGPTFLEFLKENSLDLHYAPTPESVPYSFGVSHLWRIAVDWPGSLVPPCVHRAPAELKGATPRLLLIS